MQTRFQKLQIGITLTLWVIFSQINLCDGNSRRLILLEEFNQLCILEEANIMEKVKRLGYYSILFSQDSKYLIALVTKINVYEKENILTILETSSLQKQLQIPSQGFNRFIGLTNQFLMYEHENEYIILNLANGICQKIFLQNEESRLFSFRNNFFVGWLNDELYYLRKSFKQELFSLISIYYRQNNKTVLNKIVNGKYNNYNVQPGSNKMIVYNQSMCKIFMFNHLKQIRSINLTRELVYKIILDEEVYFISVIFVHTGEINYPKIKIIHCLSCQEYTINDASDIYGNNQQFVKPALYFHINELQRKNFLYNLLHNLIQNMRQIRVESSDKLNKFILSKSHFRTFSIDKQGQERQQVELMNLNIQLQNELPTSLKEQFKQLTSQVLSKPNEPQNLLQVKGVFIQCYLSLVKLIMQILKINEPKDGSYTLREVREIDKIKVNTLLIQNNKLAIEIKQLSNKLKEIEESQDVVRLKEELQRVTQTKDEQINRLIILSDQKDKQVSKNGQLVIQLKSVIQKQDSQIQILESYLENDKKKYGNIEKTYDKLVADNRQYREQCKMQEEDLIGHYIRHRHYLREEAKSRKKLLLLQEEIDKVKVEKSKRPEIPKSDPEQEQKLLKLAYQFANDKQYFKIMKDITQFNISRLSDQEQTTIMFLKHVRYDYIYHDSLKQFTYPRPSFLLFFESNMKSLEQEYRNIDFHSITPLFFAKIRAILDSQFNEFQYHDRAPLLIKFADFVYGWISNFDINVKTREIELIANKSYEHLEPIRTDFLLDCLSPKVSKLNEIIAFNELLFELSSQDELYYYLYCRFLLFKGNISSTNRYSFEAVLYISLHWAQQILTLLLWKYDQNIFQSINQVIIESSVTKGTGTLVDGHYVLRILLELYRQERKNRLAMLKEVFSACVSVQSSGKSGVTYKNFKKIFQSNFPDVCESSICALFRESFMAGDGVVTAESFFTAASENSFFVKQILLKNLLKIPVVELNEIAYKESNLPFLDFYQHYKQLPHHLIHKCCIQFGLQSVLIELESLHKLIKGYFQDQYNQYSLYSTVTRLIHIYNSVIDLHLAHTNTFSQEWDQSEIEALKSLNNQLSQLFSPLIDYDQRQKLQQLLKQRKVKPLQLFVRKRVQRFYHMIANLINNNNIQQDPSAAKRRFTKQSSIKMF